MNVRVDFPSLDFLVFSFPPSVEVQSEIVIVDLLLLLLLVPMISIFVTVTPEGIVNVQDSSLAIS